MTRSAIDDAVHLQVVAAGLRSGTDIENRTALVLNQARLLDGLVQQHLIGPYRLDFAWPAIRVAIEVDGPMHFSPQVAARDAIRDADLRDWGWLVLRADDQHGVEGLREQVTSHCRVIHLLRREGR